MIEVISKMNPVGSRSRQSRRMGYSVSGRALFRLCDISRMLQISLTVAITENTDLDAKQSLLWGPSALVASCDPFPMIDVLSRAQ